MKKFILLFIISIAMYSFAGTEEFCEGWKEGYDQGYCYDRPTCPPHIIPQCPAPKFADTSYQRGYNKGFIAGKKAQ